RFLGPDPIGLQGGPNLFAFVGDAPLSFSDPLGLLPHDPQDTTVDGPSSAGDDTLAAQLPPAALKVPNPGQQAKDFWKGKYERHHSPSHLVDTGGWVCG